MRVSGIKKRVSGKDEGVLVKNPGLSQVFEDRDWSSYLMVAPGGDGTGA
jgi:hypothetical protein